MGNISCRWKFIDGEDLASLIKRIGYLSNEKVLEIVRQLVAGLAAAHERGMLGGAN
jgi:serine/threonine protein kinase